MIVSMFGETKTGLISYVMHAVRLVLPLSLLACGVYNRTPLLPGVNGSGLDEGSYRGTANCTSYFQTRGRAPTLDTFNMEFERQVNSSGVIMANGQALTEDAIYEITLGIFTTRQTVKILGTGADGYVVSSEARVNILDDAGNPLTLAGGANENYLAAGENVQFTLGIDTQTENAEQEVVQLAFDCTAELVRQ